MDVPRFLQSRREDIALFLPHLFQQQQSYGESEQGESGASATSGMVVNSTTEQLNRRGVFSYRRPSSKNLPFPVAAKLVSKSFDERKAVREKQRASAKQAMSDRGTPVDKNKKKTKALRSQSAAAVEAARGGSSSVTTESRLTARQRQRVWKCRLRQQRLRLRRTALRRRMRRLMDRQRGKPLVRTMRFDVGRRRHTKSNSRRSQVATTESLYLPSHRLLRARYRYTTVTRAWTTAQLGALQSLQQEQQQQQAEASKSRRRQKAESENVDAASSTTISSSSLRIAEDVRPTDDPTTLISPSPPPPPLRNIKQKQKTVNERDGRKGNVLRVRLLVAMRRSMKQLKAILTLGSSWNRHRLRQQDRRRRRQKQSGEQQEEEEEEEQLCEPQTLTGLLHDASHLFVWRLRCPSSSSSSTLRSLKEVSQLLHQCGGFAFEGDLHHTPQEEGNEVDDDAADRKDVGNEVGNAVRGFVRRGDDEPSTVIGTPNSPLMTLVSPCVLLRDPPPPKRNPSSDSGNPVLQQRGHHEDHDCCYLVTEEIPQAFSARSPHPCDPSGWTLLTTKSGGTPLLVSFVSSWSPMVHVDERVSLFRVFLRPPPAGTTTKTTTAESVAKAALAAAIQRQLRASILLLHSPDAAGAPPSDNVMPQQQQQNQQGSPPTTLTTVVSVFPLSSDAIVPSSSSQHSSTWPFLVLCRTRSSSSSITSSSLVPVQRTTSSHIHPQDDENGNTISGEPTTTTTTVLLLLHEAESLRRQQFLIARRVVRCLHRFPLLVDAHNNNSLAGWRRISECRLRPVGLEELAFFLRQIQWRSYPDSFVVTGYQQSIACSTAMQQVVVRFSAKRHSVLLRPSSRKGMGSDPIVLVRIQPAAAPAATPHELASDSQQGDNQPGHATTRRRRRYAPPLLRLAVVGALTGGGAGGIDEYLPTGDVRGVFYCWDRRVSALSVEEEEPRSTSAAVVVEHRCSSLTAEEEDSLSFSSRDRAQTPLYVAVRASTAKLLQTLEQLQRGFPVSERNLGSCPAALRERAARLLESHERHHCHHHQKKNNRGSGAQQREEEEVVRGRRSGGGGRKRNREGNTATERRQQPSSPVATTLPRVEDILVCDHCCVHAEVVG